MSQSELCIYASFQCFSLPKIDSVVVVRLVEGLRRGRKTRSTSPNTMGNFVLGEVDRHAWSTSEIERVALLGSSVSHGDCH